MTRVDPVSPPLPLARRRGYWWRLGVPLLTLAAIVGGTLLARSAVQAITDSTDGTLADNPTDPSQPGWEARLEPTAAMLALATTGSDQLAMVAILTRPVPASGGEVLLIPPETLVDGERTIAAIYRDGGAQAAGDAVETLTTVRLRPRQLVTPEIWPSLVDPVAPLVVDLPDPLTAVGETEETPEVLVPAGAQPFEGDDVTVLLSHRNPTESPIERQRRQRSFWVEWLAAIGRSGSADAVPGEADGGFGSFLRAIAGGVNEVVEYETVPGAAGSDTLAPGPGAPAQVASAVPFPSSPEAGVRPRTRVLDGSGAGQEALGELARRLAAAGAEISVIGNADSFTVDSSTIVYHDPVFESVVERLAAILPGAEVRLEPLADVTIDVTVIWGDEPDELAPEGE